MGDARIQDELKRLMETQQEVELMNFYQALPLTYRAVIVEVGEEDVSLIVQPPDSVCLTWESQTYLLAPEPLDLLQADVVRFDLLSGTVMLGNLRYGGSRLGNRMITRVNPKEPIRVELQAGPEIIMATVVDLSIRGIGLQFEFAGGQTTLHKGQIITMNIHLPETQAAAQGEVQVVGSSGEKLHVSLVFDDMVTYIRPIWQYVSRRRMEILQELQEKYLAAYMQQATGE
jgi:hypothetical protein